MEEGVTAARGSHEEGAFGDFGSQFEESLWLFEEIDKLCDLYLGLRKPRTVVKFHLKKLLSREFSITQISNPP